MENLHQLADGTKLVWDTQRTLYGEETPTRIYYPCLKTETCKYNKLLGAKIKTEHNSNWMGFENPNLRLPTEEELVELSWDFKK
jgi:hypothetical protein